MSRPSGVLVLTTVDFLGVAPGLLRDTTALSGLLVAGAGAAGLVTLEPAVVRTLPREGLAIVQLLDAGHAALHSFPDAGVLTLDLLLPAGKDAARVVDVVTRRVQAREVRAGPGGPRG